MATQFMNFNKALLNVPSREEALVAEIADLEDELYWWRKLSMKLPDGDLAEDVVDSLVASLKPLWAERARMLEVLGK